MTEPKGILRNKDEVEKHEAIGEQLDRQEVIRNTRINAHLSEQDQTKGDIIRKKIAEAKAKNGEPTYPDHIGWDEMNLYKNEQEKSATMKIDEPKTPYEKGFDPTGEYYQDDEEEIPNFTLGEAAVKDEPQSLGGEIVKDDDYEEEEPEPKPLTAEERHKKFEELRKAHYHMKGDALHKKIQISDDEDDDE